MRRLLSFLSEIILIVIFGVLLVHLLMPEIEKSIALPARSARDENQSQGETADTHRGSEVAPETVARLFGWKPKPPVKISPPTVVKKEIVVQPTPTPPVVDWITHMGFVVVDGKKRFIFKNNKSQSVFNIFVGETKQNWELIEVGENDFRFQFEGKEYTIQVE